MTYLKEIMYLNWNVNSRVLHDMCVQPVAEGRHGGVKAVLSSVVHSSGKLKSESTSNCLVDLIILQRHTY